VIAADQDLTIGLPQWYVCVSADWWQGAASGSGTPFAVVGVAHGCQRARFTAQSGAGAAFFAGYLYDREALARELQLPPADTDEATLVAAAFLRWGANLFDHVDGSYAVALWDPDSRTLLLGHDALGRHPVFYAFTAEGGLLFGSNVLLLARDDRVPARLNRLSIALGGLLFWPEAGETFFEGINRLRPGHYLVVRDGRVMAMPKYWEPMPAEDEPLLTEAEVHDGLEPALVDSVARRMALGAQGIMLSGGLDSVTVATLAAEHGRVSRRAPLVAVSGRTGGPLTAEERTQSLVSEALGMPMIISTRQDWLQGDDDVALSLEMTPELPAPTRIWWVGTYTRFYRQTAARGLQVLLTGAGGDNWLGVADAYAADLMRTLRLLELRRFVASDIVTGGASVRSAARRLLWAGGLRPLVGSAWARLAPAHRERYHARKWRERLPPWLCADPRLREALLERLVARRTPDLTPAGSVPRSYYHHSLKSLDNPYLHHENENAYHIEALCGLRLLSPYHDRRLVSFLNRIPAAVLLHGGRYKGLLRPLVERRLPRLGLTDQRKDYPADAQAAKLQRLRDSIARARAARSFDALAGAGVVDPGRLSAAVGMSNAAMSFEALARVFYLMSADRWIREHTSL
jgi:asparagine synthase (glutamine-hydrolysing)